MCLIACVVKCVMGIVNTLLLIMGIVLTVIGALLLWGFKEFLQSISSVEKELRNFLKTFGAEGQVDQVIALVSNNATSIGAIALGVGVALIALAIIGIISMACFSLKNLLIVILVLLIAITLGLIVLIAFYGINSESKVLAPLEGLILKDIVYKYVSYNSTEPESILANIIQITVHCCGVFNSSDYKSAKNFDEKRRNSSGVEINLQFPFSCCEFENDLIINQQNSDKCLNNGESKYKLVGCWTKVRPELAKYLQYAFTSIGITIGILIATIIATIILIKCADKVNA